MIRQIVLLLCYFVLPLTQGATAAEPEVKTPGPARAVPSPLLTKERLQAGWIQLFDGTTLFGWEANVSTGSPSAATTASSFKQTQSHGDWHVAEGALVCNDGKPSLLATTTRFADYELEFEAQIATGGNGGVFLRTPLNPTDPGVDCYEFNLCDTHPAFATGGLVKRQVATVKTQTDGDWHRYRVLVSGPQIEAWIDDQPVLRYTDTTPIPLTSGRIALQMNGGRAAYRNVFVRPLGSKPLFDGVSLAGWRVVPGSSGEFTVQEGSILVTGGRGFLETETTAANFCLQFSAQTLAPNLNSGVFFRALPGTAAAPSHGYEFQIHNGVTNGQVDQPVDHGTGAIFRRASARFVAARDQEWFYATLVADGPHLTTWVNGLQVVDWRDTRPPHENPREGRRDGAGHFSLQAHDPTTRLLFRDLRLSTLP